MQEIINSINEAEAKAAEIKAEAQQKAVGIAESAEERANQIARLCEEECKTLRESKIKAAVEEAEKRYNSEIALKREQAAKYAAECLKNTDGIVNDIVRRVTRGGC